MNKEKRRAVIGIVAALTAGVATIGGTFAYLTDSETAQNIIQIGSIDSQLTEPNYPGNDSPEVEGVVPNQTIDKDPMVTNVGVNDFVTFLKIEVPVKNVTLVAPDGTKGTKQKQEVFYMQKTGTAVNVFENTFNTAADGWVELTSKEEGTDLTGNTRTYVFGYAKKLEGTAGDGSAQTAANKVTSKIFDFIKMKNIVEGELVDADAVQNINITEYAIQASDIISGAAKIDTSGTISQADLVKIYDIFVNQNTSH